MRRIRFSIERLRALVLVVGLVLLVAIAASLVVGHLKRKLLHPDLPKRLGVDIQVQADGFDYTQTTKGKTIFKIHAARAVELKAGGKAQLHDVRIELYGEDGSRTDTITGAEFDYDKAAGLAQAKGPVEILLMKPGVAPAIAQTDEAAGKTVGKVLDAGKMPALVGEIAAGQIRVRTSGLSFDQKSGRATTAERVEFAVSQGSGEAMGADYDSTSGRLELGKEIHLRAQRPGGDVTVDAGHAEFVRGEETCRMQQAQVRSQGSTAAMGDALLHFRQDGSVSELDGSGGVELSSASGSRMTAPRGKLEFDGQNHPTHGQMEGGAVLTSSQDGRISRGSAPVMMVEFGHGGVLESARLLGDGGQGVRFESALAGGQEKRSWDSQIANIRFVARGTGKVEASQLTGTGGVVLKTEDPGGAWSRMSAAAMTAKLGPGMTLERLEGQGQAHFDQRTATGAEQASSADRLQAQFRADKPAKGKQQGGMSANSLVSLTETGHVTLSDQPAGGAAGLRATAARLDYDGTAEVAHLTGAGGQRPVVESGGLQLAAAKIDFNRQTGDAVADGDVKASWADAGGKGMPGGGLMAGTGGSPAHVVAAHAELKQASGEATFRGAARLWREGSSVAAPVLVLNRTRQTLHAAGDGANPVRTVLAGAGNAAKKDSLNLVRVRSAALDYSEGERVAHFTSGQGGAVSQVTAEASQAGQAPVTVNADRLDAAMLSAGVKAAGGLGVDRLTAEGRLAVEFPGRKGFGEKLVYTGDDGVFRLTGTAAARPRVVDPERGTVTGSVIRVRTADQSVEVDGEGTRTVTETRSPK